MCITTSRERLSDPLAVRLESKSKSKSEYECVRVQPASLMLKSNVEIGVDIDVTRIGLTHILYPIRPLDLAI